MNSAILRCTCVHKGQDEMYGKFRRVCNLCRSNTGGSNIRFRCTVCGSIVIPDSGTIRKFQKEKEENK